MFLWCNNRTKVTRSRTCSAWSKNKTRPQESLDGIREKAMRKASLDEMGASSSARGDIVVACDSKSKLSNDNGGMCLHHPSRSTVHLYGGMCLHYPSR